MFGGIHTETWRIGSWASWLVGLQTLGVCWEMHDATSAHSRFQQLCLTPEKQQGRLFHRFVSSSNLFPLNLKMFSPSLLSMVDQWSFLSPFLHSYSLEPETHRKGIKESYSNSHISEIPAVQNCLIKHYPEHQNRRSILTQTVLLRVGFSVSIPLMLIKMNVIEGSTSEIQSITDMK